MNVWKPAESTQEQDGHADTEIVPYVQQLNRAGIETFQSCQGHVDDEGRHHDGCLWFETDRFDPWGAADTDAFYQVTRLFAREECWEVRFRGYAEGEEAFERAMAALFENVGVQLPEVE